MKRKYFFLGFLETLFGLLGFIFHVYLNFFTFSSFLLARLFTPIKLTGTSNCSGKDFSLSIDQTTKKATLKFCKLVTSAGIGDDARIKNTITKTLTQFSTVTTVVILDRGGNCMGDESGMNACMM